MRRRVLVSLVLFAGWLLFYGVGVRRTLAPGDSAEFVLASATLGIPHPTGYPLYTLLGKLFASLPFGTIPARVNFMSAFFAALALALFFQLVRGELARRGAAASAWPAAFLAMVVLGTFPPFWRQALVAEAYTLKCAIAVALVWLVSTYLDSDRDAYLYAAALLASLGLGAHTSLAYLCLCLGAFVLPRLVHRPRLLLRCAGWFALGLSPFVYLYLRALSGPPYLHPQAHLSVKLPWTGTDNSLYNLLWFVSGGRWRVAESLSTEGVFDKARELLAVIWTELDHAALALGVLGVVFGSLAVRSRRRASALLAAAWGAEALFFVTVQPSDAAMVLSLFAWLCAFLAVAVEGLPRAALSRLRARAAGRAVAGATWIVLIVLLLAPIVSRPFLDQSRNDGDARCVERMLVELPAGSVVDGIDWAYNRMLLYYELVERRPAPFQLAFVSEADRAQSIADGRAFVIGERVPEYRAEGWTLLPFIEEPGAATLYRIARP
jgi:hypothetical protein